MSNVPTSIPTDLAGCGQPATIRIEIYEPRDGRAHGDLDGVLNVCARHEGDALEVISWDTAGMTIHRAPLRQPNAAQCGSGYDFVASQPIDASAEANSIIDQAEKALRCFEGEPLDRPLAERLLSMWSRRDELSAGDWAAVLDRFGEDADGDTDDVSIEETMAALRRLDERLQATGNTEVYALGIREGERRAQVEADQQAYARGLVDAFSAVLEPEPLALRYTDDGSTAMTDQERALEYRDYLRGWVTKHAWIVRAIEDAPGSFLWTCACGGVAIQERGEGGAAAIRAKLDAAHITGEGS